MFILGVLWAWSGGIYHLIFFSQINPAAGFFGGAFLLESVLLGISAIHPRAPPPHPPSKARWLAASLLVLYALAIYPMINSLTGHAYPRTPTFGAPCPVTIFSLGIFLVVRVRLILTLVPMLWAVIGSSAAVYFNVYADLALMGAGVVFIVFATLDPGSRIKQREAPVDTIGS